MAVRAETHVDVTDDDGMVVVAAGLPELAMGRVEMTFTPGAAMVLADELMRVAEQYTLPPVEVQGRIT